MKNIIYLFVLFTYTSYSQRICELGDYDYLFNKIKGIDKPGFSKIILLDSVNNKKLIEYRFNKLNKLESVVFTNDGTNMNLLENHSCYLRNNLIYNYKHKNKISVININKDSIREKFIINYNCNKKYKSISSDWLDIELEYKNEEIIRIKRNAFVFTYFWEDGLLRRINIYSRNKSPTRDIILTYKDKTLTKVEGLFANGKATYFYEDGLLVRIKFERMGKTFFHNFNYQNNEKIIITNTNQQGVYISHYECFLVKTD